MYIYVGVQCILAKLTPRQRKGIEFGLGLGRMFCLSEYISIRIRHLLYKSVCFSDMHCTRVHGAAAVQRGRKAISFPVLVLLLLRRTFRLFRAPME